MQWGRAVFLSTSRNAAFQGAALDKMSEGRCSEKDCHYEIGMAFAGKPFGFPRNRSSKGRSRSNTERSPNDIWTNRTPACLSQKRSFKMRT